MISEERNVKLWRNRMAATGKKIGNKISDYIKAALKHWIEALNSPYSLTNANYSVYFRRKFL